LKAILSGKGQILFELIAHFQAALDQAKGQLERTKAPVSTAKANLTRIIPLAEQNAVSKKDLDDAAGQEQAATCRGDFCRGSG